MERCPVCRARLKGGALCPRCGTDLSLPLELEQQAQVQEHNAMEWIAKGELNRAERELTQALKLKSQPRVQVLLWLVRKQQSSELLDSSAQNESSSDQKKFHYHVEKIVNLFNERDKKI